MPSPNEAFAQHLPLARRIATAYLRSIPSYVEPDDVTAAALAGLWSSAIKHHALPAEQFAAVASSRIRGSIADELRREDWLSRHARKSFGKKLRRLHIDGLEWIDGIRELTVRPEIEDEIDRADLSRELAEAINHLPKRERFVVQSLLRGRLMMKVATELGVTQARVSQIWAQAVMMLREELG